jgi:hypothetical protein
VAYAAVLWARKWRRIVPVLLTVTFGIGAYILVNQVLLAPQATTSNNAQVVGEGVETISAFSIARGLVGWWLEPERGTLILSPIYLLALAGIPRLLRWNKRIGVMLLLPLVLNWLLIAVLGGFWIAFEVGARYLVITLPLLAAPLAVALRAGLGVQVPWPRFAFGALALLLFVIGVWNGLLMMQDASYAYGSVVSAYSQIAGTDVAPLFAGLGHPALVSPRNTPLADGSNVTVVQKDAKMLWHAARGAPGIIVQSSDLVELTNGNYNLRFDAAAQGPVTAEDALLLDVFSAEGLPITHASWTGKELMSENGLKPTGVHFDNPYLNRWIFPLSLQVAATGTAELNVGALTFDPNTPTTWLRAAIWVSMVVALVVLLNLDWVRSFWR